LTNIILIIIVSGLSNPKQLSIHVISKHVLRNTSVKKKKHKVTKTLKVRIPAYNNWP